MYPSVRATASLCLGRVDLVFDHSLPVLVSTSGVFLPIRSFSVVLSHLVLFLEPGVQGEAVRVRN